ncbi:GGDEF domain-containing protein [Kineococcus terrestris]|uniref:GGDEF domain-containing protein n=1 Tax=Kineococcus terrestris TaxID=2044856 RepID=UPI0034DB4C80
MSTTGLAGALRAARGGGVRTRPEHVVLAVFLLLVAPVYLLLPADGLWRPSLYWTVLAASVAALVVAVSRSPWRRRWTLVVLAQFGFIAGEAVSAVAQLSHERFVLPVSADAAFVTADLLLLAGVLRLTRPPWRVSRGVLVDTLVVAVSVGTLLVLFALLPALDGARGAAATLTAAFFPLFDIAVVVLLARTAGWSGHRPRAYWFLAAALAGTVVADLSYALWVAGTGSYLPPAAVELCWLSFYVLCAAAAVSRSAVALGSAPAGRDTGQLRLPVLGVAAVALPLASLADELLDLGAHDHGPWLQAGTVVVVLLVLVRLSGLLRAVQAQRSEVERLAETDPLTGLPNRRAWDAAVARAFVAARAAGTPMTVAIVDLDRFKQYNDAHGHDGGDDLLREAARAWGGSLPGAFLARWGGEEFTVLLACGAQEAVQRLAAVHRGVPDGQTCSIGVATWDGAEVPMATLARADQALYRAKRTGRDRTVVAPDRAEALAAEVGG